MSDKKLCVVVKLEIEEARITSLLSCALEGGSNYWADFCNAPKGSIGVLDKEDEGKKYVLTAAKLHAGFATFAAKYPRQFAQFWVGDEDRDTGDTYLQCCIFGEAIYG